MYLGSGQDPIEQQATEDWEKQAKKGVNQSVLDEQWNTEQGLRKQKLKSAEDYAAQMGAAVGDYDIAAQRLEQAKADTIKADRFNTASAMANQLGTPIGAANQAQKQAMARRAGLEQGYVAQMTQNAAQRRLAAQAAAQAQGTLADERMKMYQAETTGLQEAINALDADAQSEVNKVGEGTFLYNTQENYNTAADNFWNKYKNNPNPSIRAAALQKAKDIRAQKYNMGGIG